MSEKPVFPLDETKYEPNAMIPIAHESFWRQAEFVAALRRQRSPMFLSAAESIDAAIILLVFQQVSQAYQLLMQALEVSLKGVLDNVKQMGISAWMAQNPALAHNLVKADHTQLKERLREKESLKQKTLITAFREVTDFIDFSVHSRSAIDRLNGTRNKLAHQGGIGSQAGNYVRELLNDIFPILDELYRKFLNLHLSDFIFHDVARELMVAARFLKHRPTDNRCWSKALTSVGCAYLHRRHLAPGSIPFDEDGFEKVDFDLRCDEWDKVSAKLWRAGSNSDVLEKAYLTCRICGERCILATDGELYHDGGLHFRITSMACPYCHLLIPEEYADLAAIHYGRIDEELLGTEEWGKFLRDYGHI